MRRRLAVLIALVGGAALASLAVLRSSEAAFSATTSNAASSLSATSMALSDNRSASALFAVSGMVPGQTASACIQLTYAGPATGVTSVRMHASAAATALAAALALRVDLGTGSATNCSDFSQTTNGIFNGTVQQLLATNGSFATGLALWTPTTAGESRSLRFTYTLPSASPSADQGKSVDPVFTFEVRTT